METQAGDPGAFAHFDLTRVASLAVSLFVLLTPQNAFGGTALLQAIDLNDLNMSTEGGKAKLYRLTSSKPARCKIEAVHYGETGKAALSFIFSAKLNYAALREYRYSQPIYMSGKFQTKLTREVLLASPEGQRLLPSEFATYKGLFDPAKLAQCSGKRRS